MRAGRKLLAKRVHRLSIEAVVPVIPRRHADLEIVVALYFPFARVQTRFISRNTAGSERASAAASMPRTSSTRGNSSAARGPSRTIVSRSAGVIRKSWAIASKAADRVDAFRASRGDV